MKNYIGISRDHSGSMRSISRVAARDFNLNIETIRENASALDQDTIISVVKCGHGNKGIVHREIVNSNVKMVQPLVESAYHADAPSTPLWDSVGELITMMENVPDVNDPNVSFLIMVITDGEENSSKTWTSRRLVEKMNQLSRTDRWSFVFRVPRGGRYALKSFGIPEGNILEWDTTEKGMEVASVATQQAFTTYFSDRSRGMTSTRSFYAQPDVSHLSTNLLENNLTDISREIQAATVSSLENGMAIRDFCENRFGQFRLGAAFYELTKKEKEVQPQKKILIRDRQTLKIYSGPDARRLLGLPDQSYATVKVQPTYSAKYEIFIQSTSTNRKLVSPSTVLYWRNA